MCVQKKLVVREAALRLFYVYIINRVVGRQHDRVAVGDRRADGRCHTLRRHIPADAGELGSERVVFEAEGG
eukprot:1712397-Prymnesium_polylepis.2